MNIASTLSNSVEKHQTDVFHLILSKRATNFTGQSGASYWADMLDERGALCDVHDVTVWASWNHFIS